MQRVLVSNTWRLLGRFFALKSLSILALVMFFTSSQVIFANSDGSLQINTDILTNNQVQTAGVGEFPIRGVLFSTPLTTLSEQIKNEQQALIEQVKTIDFSVQVKDTSDDEPIKDLLFENYQPRVLTKYSQEVNKKSNLLFWLLVPFVLVLLSVGSFAGKWRVKHRRKNKVRRFDND